MSKTTIYHDSDFEPFFVDDGTGTAYVDPGNADLLLTDNEEITVDGGVEPPTFVREFLDRETSVDPVAGVERQYTEARLDVDGQVRVGGQADPDAAPSLPEPVTTAVIAAGDAPKFLISDDPNVGLGRRLLHEAFMNFLIAAICLGIAYFFLFAD
jgi:hypothetical protein